MAILCGRKGRFKVKIDAARVIRDVVFMTVDTILAQLVVSVERGLELIGAFVVHHGIRLTVVWASGRRTDEGCTPTFRAMIMPAASM